MQSLLQNRKVLLALFGGLLAGGALGFIILAPGASSIVLKNVPEKAIVYLDNTPTSSQNSGKITLDRIEPGRHTILVATEGSWPWAKTVDVEKGERIELSIFAFPVTGIGAPVDVAADKQSDLRKEMTTLPTREDPLFSEDKSTAIWMEADVIYASWRDRRDDLPAYFCNPECKTRMEAFTSQVPIRSLSFYGKRNDLLLFAAEGGVYGLELDMRGTQNFQPLYAGVAPIFSADKNGTSITIYDTDPKHMGFFMVELP